MAVDRGARGGPYVGYSWIGNRLFFVLKILFHSERYISLRLFKERDFHFVKKNVVEFVHKAMEKRV